MKTVTIVTDSLACLTRELVSQYQIGIIPINFMVNGRIYRDWVDITPSDAYQLFLKNPALFQSSAPSPEEVLEIFKESAGQSNNILCVTVSSNLSTTYNVALLAARMAAEELPGVKVEVLDSRTATPAQGFVALAAARAAELGKSLQEVTVAARDIQQKVQAYVLLDTIRYVYRSGRIPKIASQVGSMLNIRPLFSVGEGIVHFTGAVRSRAHGIDRMLSIIHEKVKDETVHAAVLHAYALDEAQKLKEHFAAEFKCAELWVSELSPLMGYACGTGTLGIAFYRE